MSLSRSFKKKDTFPRGICISTNAVSQASCMEPELSNTEFEVRTTPLFGFGVGNGFKFVKESRKREVRGEDSHPDPGKVYQ